MSPKLREAFAAYARDRWTPLIRHLAALAATPLRVVDSEGEVLLGEGGELDLKPVVADIRTEIQVNGEVFGALEALGENPLLQPVLGFVSPLVVAAAKSRGASHATDNASNRNYPMPLFHDCSP